MNGAPVLTVGIPTFNGAATIRQALDSVIAQLQDGVEVVICDNCSTDDTGAIAREYAAARPDQVRYHRNATNVGMDRNFDAVVRQAAGRFVWVLSDDDHLVHPQAIRKVVAMATANPDVATIFANYENTVVPISRDHDSLSGDDFFQITAFKSTLISSVIVNRTLWMSYDLSGHYGTYWTHIGYLVRANAANRNCIIADILVNQIVYRQKERRWGANGTFVIVGLGLARIYDGLGAYGYSPRTIRAARRYAMERTCSGILLAKTIGLSASRAHVGEMIALFKRYPSFWLIHLPMLLLPCFLFRAAHRVYQFVRYGQAHELQ